ncbi:MAG: hypothetical protein GEU71_17040, partial [Actinobacteria bacterium]|nr:hypothetical protein [Actinomycetota bacterium]
MRPDMKQPNHERRRKRRLRRAGPFGAALIAVGLIAAACSGGSTSPGVADVGSNTPGSSASPGGSAETGELAYSQCMRDHGIEDFPDPGPDGEISIDAGPGSDLAP